MPGNRPEGVRDCYFANGGYCLQKSKVAEPRILRENTKRETIADSYTLNRVAEVARDLLMATALYHSDRPLREIFTTTKLDLGARRILSGLCPFVSARRSAAACPMA